MGDGRDNAGYDVAVWRDQILVLTGTTGAMKLRIHLTDLKQAVTDGNYILAITNSGDAQIYVCETGTMVRALLGPAIRNGSLCHGRLVLSYQDGRRKRMVLRSLSRTSREHRSTIARLERAFRRD